MVESYITYPVVEEEKFNEMPCMSEAVSTRTTSKPTFEQYE